MTTARLHEIAEPPPRAQELLSSIRVAFARKGFDATSMKDLAQAAGISAGNFYRYFPSKLALLEALIAADMAEVDQDFERILKAADPALEMRARLAERLEEDHEPKGVLWAEITAAGLRESQIAETCKHFEALIETRLIEVFARIHDKPVAQVQEILRPHAHYIVLIMKAAASRRPDEVTPAVNRLIQRGLDRVFEDVAALASENLSCA